TADWGEVERNPNKRETCPINPRGKATTTTYMAYGQPTMDWPTAIAQSGGVYTDIDRDAFGKPLSITRRNASGTISLTRAYAYNSAQELCASAEPETGTTKYTYDGAGNLTETMLGLSTPLPASCSSTFALGDPGTGGSNPPSLADAVRRA